MIKETLKKILSLNGISILIGIIGGTVGLLSIFINWDWKVSIKWLAATIIFFSFLLLISFLVVYEIYKLFKYKYDSKIQVIKFSTEHFMILVENNRSLEFSQTVTLYYDLNNFQILLARGFVQNIQDKFTQIKIVEFDEDFVRIHPVEYQNLIQNNKESLDSVLIKNYHKHNG